MKALLILFVALVAGIAGLGFYRGWFSFASDSADAKSHITLSMDKGKMQADEKTAIAKVEDFGRQVKDMAAPSARKTIDGTVVRVSGDNLTMTTKEGKEHSHALAANVQVTCDGKTCTATDLKAGMRIRVTTDTADRHAAARIEALDKDAAFASSSHDGKAVSITGAKLVMSNMEGAEEHTYTLTADIKVTRDGKVCKAADLKPGMRVRVTTENAEPQAATRIEALDNNQGFEKGA
jgi:hypothetical protein